MCGVTCVSGVVGSHQHVLISTSRSTSSSGRALCLALRCDLNGNKVTDQLTLGRYLAVKAKAVARTAAVVVPGSGRVAWLGCIGPSVALSLFTRSPTFALSTRHLRTPFNQLSAF